MTSQMPPRTGPRANADDLTAKAKIRNAALDLYAAKGEDGTSMRAIATAAGVTVGLLVHHYGTKDGIRAAVEDVVVDHFAQAIAEARDNGSPRQVAAARDRTVGDMLARHPEVVNYMRRALLEPGEPRGSLLEKLIDLTRREVAELRAAGLASTDRAESSQIIETVTRQVGQLFLQPMVDAMWQYLSGPHATDDGKPTLTVGIRKDTADDPARRHDGSD